MSALLFLRGAAVLALVCTGLIPAATHAQEYPSRNVTIVVPATPGGGLDFAARLFAGELSKGWKYPIVIDNRPGAAGLVATEVVARAQPDGYTLLVHNPDQVLAYPIFLKLQFDPEKDLTPVSYVFGGPRVCVTNNDSPAKNWADFVKYAKANPGKLNMVDYPKISNHLEFLRLMQMARIELTLIPYNGEAAGSKALIANDVQLFCASPSIASQVRAGRLIALAVTSPERTPTLPDTPTFKSLGLDFEQSSPIGFFVPGGTPKDIIEKLAAGFGKAAKLPEIAAKVEAIGFQVEYYSHAESVARVAASGAKYKKIARDFNIKQE